MSESIARPSAVSAVHRDGSKYGNLGAGYAGSDVTPAPACTPKLHIQAVPTAKKSDRNYPKKGPTWSRDQIQAAAKICLRLISDDTVHKVKGERLPTGEELLEIVAKELRDSGVRKDATPDSVGHALRRVFKRHRSICGLSKEQALMILAPRKYRALMNKRHKEARKVMDQPQEQVAPESKAPAPQVPPAPAAPAPRRVRVIREARTVGREKDAEKTFGVEVVKNGLTMEVYLDKDDQIQALREHISSDMRMEAYKKYVLKILG